MLDLSDMNESQRRAVTYGEGPLLLLAGPGSGKTFTITRRILWLLEQGVPPDRILVITFTREAAESMQRRFQKVSKGLRPVNFGTFHSVFFHMLRSSDTLKSLELLTNTQKYQILLPILKAHQEKDICGAETELKQGNGFKGASSDSLREDAAGILAAVSYYKNTLCREKAVEKVPARWRECFFRILEEYEKAVLECGRMDFDDMLCRCRKLLLEDAAFRKAWQGRFLHILIDEFQDTNPVQYETVRLLVGNTGSIFAVGDDDQSIYGFRGSEPECLKRFKREYEAEQMLLDINYRSHPEIVSASLAVIGENRDRFEKALRPDPGRERENGGRVALRAFQDKEEQYSYLVKRLKEITAARERDGSSECAVLFRTNSRMQGLAVRLRAAGIPYMMGERMESIYGHFIAKDMTAYLRLAAGERSRELLLSVINRPSRYVSREAAGAGDGTVKELIKYYRYAEIPERRRKEILENLSLFERQLEALGKFSPGLGISYIRKALGYERYLRQTAAGDAGRLAEWLELLDWLRADAGRFQNVRDWCDAQREHNRALEENKKSSKRGGSGEEKAAVKLMTVHGSKGLEFETVIIPDCNEGVFPHGRLLKEHEAEEERRVFYVAMTRAKENLELLCLTGEGSTRPPSRFLDPLLQLFPAAY